MQNKRHSSLRLPRSLQQIQHKEIQPERLIQHKTRRYFRHSKHTLRESGPAEPRQHMLHELRTPMPFTLRRTNEILPFKIPSNRHKRKKPIWLRRPNSKQLLRINHKPLDKQLRVSFTRRIPPHAC